MTKFSTACTLVSVILLGIGQILTNRRISKLEIDAVRWSKLIIACPDKTCKLTNVQVTER